jgi:hypothetical protein
MSTLALRCSMLIAGLCMVGCKKQNDNYCADAPHTNCMNIVDAPSDGHCMNDQQCAPNICDLTGSMMCVQCTSSRTEACTAATPACGPNNMCVQCTSSKPEACIATTPVCSTDNTCRGCRSHSECSSNVCLADGSCAAEASVAYVAPTPAGSGNTCGKLTPCGTLQAAIQTDRPYVKVAPGLVKDGQTTTIDGKTVTIVADVGAKLDRDGDGPILVIQSSGAAGANVRIFDLEITGATGAPGGDAVRLTASGGTPSLELTRVTINKNQGVGVTTAGGSLIISLSTFGGNDGGAITATNSSLTVSRSMFSGNEGGGISQMNGTFIIVGNVFFDNGGNTSLIGGISIGTSTNAANRLEFNSFALNTTTDGVGPAIQCLAGTFNAKNNILSDNRTPTPQANQFAGTCTHTFSIMRPGTVPNGNSGSDPLFADPAKGNLHLTTESPARRAADPGSDLTGIAARDIDGVARISPAAIGAYEFNASAASLRSRADGAQQ